MKNPLGVMQGRLLPKYKGRYQAHPVGYWADEFPIAQSLGLDCIEFILDYNDYEKNPLTSNSGIKQILEVIKATDVKVYSICADYFMEAPFHATDQNVVSRSKEVLNQLLEISSEIGVKDIVIPSVDQSSLKSECDQDRFVSELQDSLVLAKKNNINLSLETDLNPNQFLKLLNKFNQTNIKVNYDIGNSASLGFDPKEEFEAYGKFISDIHIKDRILGGSSVALGNGSTDFAVVMDCISSINYKCPFIMQAYRDDEGLEIFKSQLSWVRENMNGLLS